MALHGLIRAEVPLIRHYSLNVVFVEITSSTLYLDSLEASSERSISQSLGK